MTIEIIKRNSTNYEKTILVIGVFHGDEPQGEYLIKEFLKIPKRNFKNRLVYIPRLNSNSERKNPNGVDLNRNYPAKNWELGDKTSNYYGGDFPASEIETKAVIKVTEEIQPDAIISIHAPFKIVNYDGPEEKTRALAEKISEITGYPTQKEIGYATPGSFGTYMGLEKEIPTITIEVDEEVPVIELLPKFTNLFNYLEDEY
ncbi:hypothetical protein IKA15_02785 [bacterium]|nr:hypothetical protein [bacterium]